MADDPARRARALIGCRYRPQGRDPDAGLDCVGVIAATFGAPAETVPSDYRLRGDHRVRLERTLRKRLRRVAQSRAAAGDVLLMQVEPDQLHLAVRTDAGFVHADARLRRVVETPGDPPWPILAAFRAKRRG